MHLNSIQICSCDVFDQKRNAIFWILTLIGISLSTVWQVIQPLSLPACWNRVQTLYLSYAVFQKRVLLQCGIYVQRKCHTQKFISHWCIFGSLIHDSLQFDLTLVLRLLVLEKRAIKKIFIGCSNNEKIDQRSQIVRVNISE